MLKSLSLKGVYRSEEDNILQDFYIPALKQSIRYDRAVGFFSSAMLSHAAQGISAFVKNGGYMRLIIGASLDIDEWEAVQKGYEERAKIIELLGQKMIDQLMHVDNALFERRLEALSWLVANGHLDLKIALRKQGMYHEKIGIMTDQQGDQVIFQGSANESVHALIPEYNFESINVFCSWKPAFAEHFEPHIKFFRDLWDDKVPNTIVADAPEILDRYLCDQAQKVSAPFNETDENKIWESLFEKREIKGRPSIPEFINGQEFKIFDHQKDALHAWKANGARGVLALATGAGKTITSIYGAVKLYEALNNRLFLIIAVPYQSLADQWVEILKNFNINAIKCYVSRNLWFDKFSDAVFQFNQGNLDIAAAVVVNRTLTTDDFQNLLKQIPENNFLWIGDECHRHGSFSLNKMLPQNAFYRLGLSATPEDYMDAEANQRLFDYYGNIVKRFELKDALEAKVLTPYTYQVELVSLTDEEIEEYIDLCKQIARCYSSASKQNLSDDPKLNALLLRRSRLLGSAQNKIIQLKKVLAERPIEPHTLFFCGDGSLSEDFDDQEDQDDGNQIRQVELVTKIVHDRGWKTSRFTAREGKAQRTDILENFKLGLIDGLVAIKCLDEGIDIPACQTAYMIASARNPRQFIQRRGRILRKSSGKEKAHIIDFIIYIPAGISINSDYETNLLKAELKRVAEFASLSLNRSECYMTLRPLLLEYDLEHVIV